MKPAAATWLDPVREALDAAEDPVSVFVRDDDGGWGDASLRRLLACAEPYGVTVDVAVIPAAISRDGASDLVRWIDRGVATVHQHGWEHVSKVGDGRACEFGEDRLRTDVFADLRAGRDLLADLFAESAQPVFTPPWNRCSQATAECLVELGFEVLSRESGAEPFDIEGLREVPVHFDWFAKRKRVPLSRDERGEQLAALVRGGEPIGVMLHHAVTDAEELGEIAALFELIATSPMARTTSILDLARS